MRLALLITFFVFASMSLLAQNTISSCEKLSLKGPRAIIQPGDAIHFSVEAPQGKLGGMLRYVWKVDGVGFAGQGTSRIEIQTERRIGNKSVGVFVKVLDIEKGCSTLLSDSAGVGSSLPGPDHYWYELTSRRKNDLKGQLELINTPAVEGIIEITSVKGGNGKRGLSILSLISKHIVYRRIEPSRISYYLTIGEYERIRTIRMPPGADYD